MKKIKYTPDAADKLRELKKVITKEYNDVTAKKIISNITDAIRGLCDFEKKGDTTPQETLDYWKE